MHFAFTDDQLLSRAALRDMLARECTAAHVRAAWESADGRVPGLWARLADMGVLGLTVPERHGGMGMDELDLVLLLEEMGRAGVPEPVVETTAVAAPLLRELARNAEQGAFHAEWLGRIAAGEAVVAVGLEGMPLLSHAGSADLLLMQRGGELHALDIRSGSGRERIQLTPHRSVDGSRRLFGVRWEPGADTLVSAGEPARRALAAAFDRAALAVSAQLVGIAQRLIETTVEYVKVRRQFGQPIGAFQAVKHHLANANVQLAFSRPAVYRAAYSVARGHDHDSGDVATHVSMAKAHASDAALLAARVALQCHGAMGYAYEYDLHLWMKRAWALAASYGDAAWHRRRIGDAILGPARAM